MYRILPVLHPCMSIEPFWRVPRGCWSLGSSSSISSTRCPGNNMGTRLEVVSPRHLYQDTRLHNMQHSVDDMINRQLVIPYYKQGYDMSDASEPILTKHTKWHCEIFFNVWNKSLYCQKTHSITIKHSYKPAKKFLITKLCYIQ